MMASAKRPVCGMTFETERGPAPLGTTHLAATCRPMALMTTHRA